VDRLKGASLAQKKKSSDPRVPTARRMKWIELCQRKRLWNRIEQCMNRRELQKKKRLNLEKNLVFCHIEMPKAKIDHKFEIRTKN
jgi:hypothetical protein